MKKLHKILLFLFSLTGFACSIGILSLFIYIPAVTETLALYRSAYPWTDYLFIGFSVLVCLIFFLLLLAALFSPVKTNDMVFTKDKGKLRFSRQTVESTVRYSFADVDGVNFSKIRAKISKEPGKAEIFVKLSLNDPSKLAGLAETVQDKIESALKQSLGITVKAINIKVAELSTENKTQKEKSMAIAKDSRVE